VRKKLMSNVKGGGGGTLEVNVKCQREAEERGHTNHLDYCSYT